VEMLKHNVRDDYQERPGQVEEEPVLYRFDVRSDREALGHREID